MGVSVPGGGPRAPCPPRRPQRTRPTNGHPSISNSRRPSYRFPPLFPSPPLNPRLPPPNSGCVFNNIYTIFFWLSFAFYDEKQSAFASAKILKLTEMRKSKIQEYRNTGNNLDKQFARGIRTRTPTKGAGGRESVQLMICQDVNVFGGQAPAWRRRR